MPQYKLTYYDTEGLAEPIRYMFAVAGVDYEDHRIPKDADHHPKLPPHIKDDLPWGTIPVLEIDGKHRIAQSGTIFRFLGKRLNLNGADEFESVRCDELSEAIKDFLTGFFTLTYETDDIRKMETLKKLKEITIPYYMDKFNKIAEANGKWLVGKNMTWIDIVVAHLLTLIMSRFPLPLLDGYPALQRVLDDVYAVPKIKEWMNKRPATG